ncbi:MAG TPA: M20 family metallo-hydrolase [Ginsengibacter sp.]|nr:M20 family metallo-hydrolase [Ginsengibacter sp.]
MNPYKQRAEKVETRIQELAKYSDETDRLSRILGTKAFTDCGDKIESWMKEAGLQTYIDNMGNIRGKLPSEKKDAKTFVIASHFDTVIDAGKYDGTLGILAGLDIIEKLKTEETKIPFDIELIAFSDGEGVRFQTSFLGSKTITGNFNTNLLEKRDDYGITLETVLQNLRLDSSKLLQDIISPKKWMGYYEIHIEQAPVLYKNNIAAGIVTGIAGQKRVTIEFSGVAGHVGNVPMNSRKDALTAAAEFIVAVEKFASAKKSNIIATVGKLEVEHAARNTIPAKVLCSLDFRSMNKKKLAKAYEDLNELCEDICNKRKVYFEWNLVQETNPIACDERLTRLLKKSIKEVKMEVVELESGVSHDSVIISSVAPVAMLFVKCYKGISHSPLEKVDIKDIATVLEISDNFMQQLIQQ